MKKEYLLLVLLIIFHLAGNALWLSSNQVGPVDDEVGYYLKSLRIYSQLRVAGLDLPARILEVPPRHRPPVFPLLPCLFYPVFGSSFSVAGLVSTLFFAVTIFFVYRMGILLAGRREGLIAAFLFSFYPFSIEFSHRFFSEAGLISLFVVSLYLLLRTRTFASRKYSVLLGFALGLGMLTKQNYIFFMAVPFLIEGLRAFFSGNSPDPAPNRPVFFTRPRVNVLITLFIGLLVAAPFYLDSFRNMGTGFRSISMQAAAWDAPEKSGNLLDFFSHIFALERLMGPVFFLLFIVALVSAIIRRRRGETFLLFTLGGGYLFTGLFFLFFINEDRNISPLLPPAALLTAGWLARIGKKPVRLALVALICVTGIAVYLWTAWSLPASFSAEKGLTFKIPRAHDRLALLPRPRPPVQKADWKVDEIMNALEGDSQGSEVLLYVVPGLRNFRGTEFREWALLKDRPVKISVPPWKLCGMNYKDLISADYIIIKDGPVKIRETRGDYREEVARCLLCPPSQWGENHAVIGEFPLPDNTMARLIKRTVPANESEKCRFREMLDDTPRRLPARPGPDSSPRIVFDGESLIVAYCGDIAGRKEIFQLQSDDGGLTWSSRSAARNAVDPDELALTAEGGTIMLAWSDRSYGDRNISSLISTDGGKTWTFERITENPGWSGSPSVAIDGKTRHLVWVDSSFGNRDIFYKRNESGTFGWQFQPLSDNPGRSDHTSVAARAGIVHVVWEDDSYGNLDILYRRSTDGGLTWEFQRLSENPGVSRFPVVAAEGSSVHVVWQDGSYGTDELFYKRSTDRGNSWAFQRLTSGGGAVYSTALAVERDKIHVTYLEEPFPDDRTGPLKVMYVYSTDNGITWTTKCLSVATVIPAGPALAAASGNAHVIWIDGTFGKPELLYRKKTGSEGGGPPGFTGEF